MIYTYIADACKDMPDSMKPAKVFNLGSEPVPDASMSVLARLANGEGNKKKVARRIFRRVVRNLED